jgi:hypothetical protein
VIFAILTIALPVVIVSWLIPRMFWTYRYWSWFSVLLLSPVGAIFGALTAATSASLTIWVNPSFAGTTVLFTNLVEEESWLLNLAALSGPLALFTASISGAFYARRLASGGSRFGSRFRHWTLWAMGFLVSQLVGLLTGWRKTSDS